MLSDIAGDGAQTHGQRLPADLERALDAAGVTLDDVGLLAVVAGPGSFTGLRVGIAAMQGLAFSRGLRVVAVSALDVLGRLARRAASPSHLAAAWIDAQRGEVYAALYDGDAPVTTPSNLPPAQTLEAWRDHLGSRPVVFAGDGAIRYHSVIAERLGSRALVIDPAPALAAEAVRAAAEHPDRAVAPHAIVPIYVRRPDAELARSREGR